MQQLAEATQPVTSRPKASAQPEFQWEPFGSVIKEALPMLQGFWNETEPHGDVYPFDMDFDTYFELERKGMLAVYVARVEGTLIGAHWWMVTPNLRRRTVLHATSDCILLSPAWRNGWTGYKLLTGSEPGLKRIGVKIARVTVASKYNLDPLLKRAGYVPVGVQYEKILEWPDGRERK